MAGRPLFQGLAVLCAVCMMSMIIMDRISRVNVVVLSADETNSQDAIFSKALESARQEEAKFSTQQSQSLSHSMSKSNPYLNAAKDLETAGKD